MINLTTNYSSTRVPRQLHQGDLDPKHCQHCERGTLKHSPCISCPQERNLQTSLHHHNYHHQGLHPQILRQSCACPIMINILVTIQLYQLAYSSYLNSANVDGSFEPCRYHPVAFFGISWGTSCPAGSIHILLHGGRFLNIADGSPLTIESAIINYHGKPVLSTILSHTVCNQSINAFIRTVDSRCKPLNLCNGMILDGHY